MLRLGKIYDEPIEVYHATNAVSKSKIDVFRQSPLLYHKKFVLETLVEDEKKEHLVFGAAAGVMIIEGMAAFASRYYVIPAGVGRQRKEHKEIRLALEAEHPGKEAIDAEDVAIIMSMRESLKANPEFAILTAQGRPEVTFRMQGKHFAVQVRPDWIAEEGCALTEGYPYCLDLKSIHKLPCDEPDFLAKHVAEFGYHRQAYLYPEVVATVLKFPAEVPRPRFFFAFVEKQEPFDSMIVELSETDIEVGQREVTSSLVKLRRCYETNTWASPRRGISKLSLPSYYIRQSLEASEPILEDVA